MSGRDVVVVEERDVVVVDDCGLATWRDAVKARQLLLVRDSSARTAEEKEETLMLLKNVF